MLIGTAPRFWIWGCHRFEKLPCCCRDMAILMCLAPSMCLRHREYVVETEQMSSVETRQMSQQQSSVLSQQQTSVLSQQKTSILSQLVRSLSRTRSFRHTKPTLPASVGRNFTKRFQEPRSKRTRPTDSRNAQS